MQRVAGQATTERTVTQLIKHLKKSKYQVLRERERDKIRLEGLQGRT